MLIVYCHRAAKRDLSILNLIGISKHLKRESCCSIPKISFGTRRNRATLGSTTEKVCRIAEPLADTMVSVAVWRKGLGVWFGGVQLIHSLATLSTMATRTDWRQLPGAGFPRRLRGSTSEELSKSSFAILRLLARIREDIKILRTSATRTSQVSALVENYFSLTMSSVAYNFAMWKRTVASNATQAVMAQKQIIAGLLRICCL